MKKIITIANQKGGVGKTTTAAALVCGLHHLGKTAVGIDAAPQCSLSYLLGADMNQKTIKDALHKVKTSFMVQHTPQGDILPGDKSMAAAQVRPADLWRTVRGVTQDYVIIDTDPGLSSLLLSALYAADLVIIPAKANAGSLQGITDTASTVRVLGKDTPCAVLFTGIHTRTGHAEAAFMDAIRQNCDTMGLHVFDTVIRYAEAPITDSEARRQSVIAYNLRCKPSQDYFALIDEMKL